MQPARYLPQRADFKVLCTLHKNANETLYTLPIAFFPIILYTIYCQVRGTHPKEKNKKISKKRLTNCTFGAIIKVFQESGTERESKKYEHKI